MTIQGPQQNHCHLSRCFLVLRFGVTLECMDIATDKAILCNFVELKKITMLWLPGIVYLHSWDQHHARQEEHDHQGVPDGNVHQICNMNSCRYLPFALPPETMPRDRMANQWILSPVLQIIFFLPADRVLFCQFFQISKVMTFSSSCPTARPIEYHLSSGTGSFSHCFNVTRISTCPRTRLYSQATS